MRAAYAAAGERAISLAEELRGYYQHTSYEFDKISQLLKLEAECYANIVQRDRFFSNYFRVVYYGPGFSYEIRVRSLVSDIL